MTKIGSIYWIANAFATHPEKGNPAAVTVVDHFPDETLMQSIAKEINLSETCFVKRLDNGDYHIRWFTPTTEVKLCGHATLVAAHILKNELNYPEDKIVFNSLSGDLSVCFIDDLIQLNFPCSKLNVVPVNPKIVSALGGGPVSITMQEATDDGFLIYAYDKFETLSDLNSDFDALSRATDHAVIVTAKMDKDYDYAVRVFAPQYGVNEDPVTGSAQCALAPFWSSKLNQSNFKVLQVSERTGELIVACQGDRVTISGQVILVSKRNLVFG
jgi:predicted PhzF superfamily epimerase YddE/YHI9